MAWTSEAAKIAVGGVAQVEQLVGQPAAGVALVGAVAHVAAPEPDAGVAQHLLVALLRAARST